MKAQLLLGLKSVFPQFQNKSTLIEYYCSYDFPKKQTHLLKMWQDLLNFVNSYFGTLTLSQKELHELFQIFELKPKPLVNVFKALHKNKQIYSISDIQRIYNKNFLLQNQQPKKGILTNIFSYFYQSSKKQVELDDQIFLKDVVDRKLLQSHCYIRQIFKYVRVCEENDLIQKLKIGLKLSKNVDIILDILTFQNKITRVKHFAFNNMYYLVIYPGQGIQITQNMIELQKTRFDIRQKISQINHKIQQIYPELIKLMTKAKQFISQGDKNMSKNLLKQKIIHQKHIAILINIRQLLNNSINQLDQNQINQNILSTLKQSQDLIKSSIADIDNLEDIQLNNQQIKFNLQQADKIYKQVAGNNLQQDNLYEKLQMQLRQENNKVQHSKNVKIPSITNIPQQKQIQQSK